MKGKEKGFANTEKTETIAKPLERRSGAKRKPVWASLCNAEKSAPKYLLCRQLYEYREALRQSPAHSLFYYNYLNYKQKMRWGIKIDPKLKSRIFYSATPYSFFFSRSCHRRSNFDSSGGTCARAKIKSV